MSRVVHFDINSKNPDRAIKFYETIFNWKFKKWEGPLEYCLIKTGEDSEPGINGGMGKVDELPGFETSVIIDVKSIDNVIMQIKNLGGIILEPKMFLPGAGWFAKFEDTEGNKLGLMQEEPSAN